MKDVELIMSDTRYTRLNTNNIEEISPDGITTNEEEIELNSVIDEEEIKIETSQQFDEKYSNNNNNNKKIMHLAVGTLFIIVIYLTLSICLTFYQKWVLKTLKFPLTIVLYHLIIKFIMSIGVRVIYKLTTGRSRVHLDWKTSFKKMAPTGMASGIDIGFSNVGLGLVLISLYTMTKSSTIIFILIFAILLGLEKMSGSLIVIVVMISGGLFMFTYKATHFDVIGFSFLLFASFSSGLRWSFAQLIMQKSKLGLHNPIDMIFHMQPWMILSIIPFTIGFEGYKLIDAINELPNKTYDQIVVVLAQITFGALIAFVMEVSEFLVLSYTSSLTLSIAGIFKEICQLVLAVELNGDQLTLINVLGLVLCLGGICAHIIHKYSIILSPRDENIYDIETNGGLTRNLKNNSGKNHVTFRKSLILSGNNNDDDGKLGQSTVPLLDSNDLNNSDSDESQNDNSQNASEVIFDVLKRRDHVR